LVGAWIFSGAWILVFGASVPGSQQNSFFIGPFDLDAVGFDARVVFKGLVNNTPVKSIERL
jgi:hypothetical protein